MNSHQDLVLLALALDEDEQEENQCLHCSQIILLFSLLNGFAVSQTVFSNLSTNNEETALQNVSQKYQNENLITMKMTTDMRFVGTDKPNEHVSNVGYAVSNVGYAEDFSPIAQGKKRRLKRNINEQASERPPIFLLALEEVKKPGCKEKREISQKVIPLCLYALGKTLRKRALVNDSIVDKVIEKYFPKIKEKPPVKFKYRVKNYKSPDLRRNIRFFKQDDYPLSSEPLNIDKLDVITEANKTLNHISKLTECDSVEMPDEIKKPLIEVLYKRISNIYADKSKIKNQ